MDFTAVDECADAYVRLVLHNRINNIYHLYNPHLFTIEKLSSKLLFKCKQVPKELYDKLDSLNNNEEYTKLINEW